jgi:hypothetical protein
MSDKQFTGPGLDAFRDEETEKQEAPATEIKVDKADGIVVPDSGDGTKAPKENKEGKGGKLNKILAILQSLRGSSEDFRPGARSAVNEVLANGNRDTANSQDGHAINQSRNRGGVHFGKQDVELVAPTSHRDHGHAVHNHTDTSGGNSHIAVAVANDKTTIAVATNNSNESSEGHHADVKTPTHDVGHTLQNRVAAVSGRDTANSQRGHAINQNRNGGGWHFGGQKIRITGGDVQHVALGQRNHEYKPDGEPEPKKGFRWFGWLRKNK